MPVGLPTPSLLIRKAQSQSLGPSGLGAANLYILLPPLPKLVIFGLLNLLKGAPTPRAGRKLLAIRIPMVPGVPKWKAIAPPLRTLGEIMGVFF